jgi:serine/threonine-protein kinase
MPDEFAQYRVLKKLGAGGMGEVFLAQDTRLNRKVAIKFMHASDHQAARRLLREAQAAAGLSHPNICAIHEVGEDAGRSFIVMEYVEGETLDETLKRAPLAVDRALAIGADIADALAEAHRHGIVHRDVKPSNVIVTPRGRTVVMDFGLASGPADAEGDAETQSGLTAPNSLAGTVPYMSPEQLRGDALDPRTDLFSLGVLLYETVSGRRPFKTESAAATAASILTAEPPPITTYRGDVPAELQRIVRKCLEKDRERRYQSAADLKLDLQNLRHGVHPVRRTWPRSVAAFAVLGLLVAAGAWYASRHRAAPVEPGAAIRSIAVFPFANSSGDEGAEYLSDGITESLINNFSRLTKLRVIARTTMFRYKGKDVDPQAIGRDLGVDAALTGRVFRQGDTLAIQAELMRVSDGSQLWGDRFDRKLADMLAIQDEIAGRIGERLSLQLTGPEQQLITKRYTDNADAYDLYLKGRYFSDRLTEEALEKSIPYYQQAIAIDPRYALAYVGLANTYGRLGGVLGFRSPRETGPRMNQYLQKALQLDRDLADAYTSLASYKISFEWNWAEGEQAIKRALELNPNDSLAHQSYGSLHSLQGRTDAAIAERRAAQRLDPLSPFATANAGYPYYYARRYDEALKDYRKALELDPNYSWAHLWIGQAYVQQERYADAIESITKAIRFSGGDTRAVATLGYAYAVAGRRDDALKVLNDLQRLSRTKYVSPYFIAVIRAGLNKDEQAIDLLEAAYEERHPYLIFLKVEPVFDRLRGNPRFVAVEKRVGLQP